MPPRTQATFKSPAPLGLIYNYLMYWVLFQIFMDIDCGQFSFDDKVSDVVKAAADSGKTL